MVSRVGKRVYLYACRKQARAVAHGWKYGRWGAPPRYQELLQGVPEIRYWLGRPNQSARAISIAKRFLRFFKPRRRKGRGGDISPTFCFGRLYSHSNGLRLIDINNEMDFSRIARRGENGHGELLTRHGRCNCDISPFEESDRLVIFDVAVGNRNFLGRPPFPIGNLPPGKAPIAIEYPVRNIDNSPFVDWGVLR